jgi:hypothetical protein
MIAYIKSNSALEFNAIHIFQRQVIIPAAHWRNAARRAYLFFVADCALC